MINIQCSNLNKNNMVAGIAWFQFYHIYVMYFNKFYNQILYR